MENTNVKLTKAMKFNYLIALLENNDFDAVMMEDVNTEISTDELVAFLRHEVELVTKKNTGAKAKKATDEMKDAILALASTEPQPNAFFVSALTEQGFEDVTAAKVSARLSALVREEKLVKEPVKKIQHYSIA